MNDHEIQALQAKVDRYEKALRQIHEHGGNVCEHFHSGEDGRSNHVNCDHEAVNACSEWTWFIADWALHYQGQHPAEDIFNFDILLPPGTQAWWEREGREAQG